MANLQKEVLANESVRWKTFITEKLEERNLEYLLTFTEEEKEFLQNMTFVSGITPIRLNKNLSKRGSEFAFTVSHRGKEYRAIGNSFYVYLYISKHHFSAERTNEILHEFLNEFGLEKLMNSSLD